MGIYQSHFVSIYLILLLKVALRRFPALFFIVTDSQAGKFGVDL